jgi:hypothetical protein
VEAIDRGPQPFGPDRVECARDGALGADHRRERCRQLGDVVGQQQVRRRAFTEAEVDRPGDAVVGEEDVREPKIAVCDARLESLGRRVLAVHDRESVGVEVAEGEWSSDRPSIASYASTNALGSAVAIATSVACGRRCRPR